MAELDRPYPPGRYPVVVVGSGAGGLQMSYALRALGIEHALLSSDDVPGGMFRRFPIFERLITWTKPYGPYPRTDRAYEWYDWNSLIAEEPENRALVAQLAEGARPFPARAEMEAGIVAFAERTKLAVRYGCRWESTRVEPDGFTLVTADGEYGAQALVLAVGMTEPWTPAIDGIEHARHYVETRAPKEYAGKRVFIAGKRNSGFEVADGLLASARQIVLASPRPARLSVIAHSTAAARAVYLLPYEEHVLGGGTIVLDASIDRIERGADGFRVTVSGTTKPGAATIEADEVIAATGFSTPLNDLPDLGVKMFSQGRLPAQTPFWESTSMPGIYFAGSATQGSVGLKKYGIASSSAAVHGFRYNARVLAEHLAKTRFGRTIERAPVGDVVERVLGEAATAPELWNQQAYLARVISLEPPRDEGILPLVHFLDTPGPDAIAVTVETDDAGDIHPAVYLRRGGTSREERLEMNELRDPRTDRNRDTLRRLLA